MDDQRNVAYEYMIQAYKEKLYPERNIEDINTLVNMIISSLEKGLTEIEWMDIINAIKSLPSANLILGLAGTKSKEGNYYYYFIPKKTRKFGKNLFFTLRKIFATPRKRRYLKDLDIKNDITTGYIIELLEEGLENGLSRNQQTRFKELVYFLYYTTIEMTIDYTSHEKTPFIKITCY